MSRVLLASLFVLVVALSNINAQNADKVNLYPVIGILAIPSDYGQFPINNWNYMAASYVKYVESSGARVVPIQWDLPIENLTAIMRRLNGFLITGGDAIHVKDDNKTLTPFGKAIENIVNLVIQFNNEGTHYPLWGTCMGFQLISCIIAGQSSGNYNCLYSQKGFLAVRSNMSFFQESSTHPIFTNLSADLRESFLQDGITFFNFHYTVQRNLWEDNIGLKTNFSRLTYVLDDAATNISVLIAGTKYPIYGSQFHPEKIQFEWTETEDIPHSYQAVLGAQLYANYFVDEARKNFNTFDGSGIDLDSIIIYNYNPIQIPNSSFDQIYFFQRVQPGPPYFLESNELLTENIDAKTTLEFLQS